MSVCMNIPVMVQNVVGLFKLVNRLSLEQKKNPGLADGMSTNKATVEIKLIIISYHCHDVTSG